MRDAAGPVTGAAGAARRGGARDDPANAATPAIGGSSVGVAEGDVFIPRTRLASQTEVACLRGVGRSRGGLGFPATPDIARAADGAADGAADERRASSTARPAGRGGGGGGGVGGVPSLASRGGGGGMVLLSRSTPTWRTEVSASREGVFVSSRSEASDDAAMDASFNFPVTASGDGRLACSLDRVAVSAPALKSETRPHFIACAFQSSH